MATTKQQQAQLVRDMYDAAYPGDVTAMRQLLKRGGDPNGSLKGYQFDVLDLAAQNREVPELTRLLLNAGARATQTAVCHATKDGAVESLKLLLKAGGDPNGRMRFGRANITRCALELLSFSAEEDKPFKQKLDLLLKAGADVNGRGGHGAPALHLVFNRVHGERIFALANAATRRTIIQRALLPHGMPDDMRRDLLEVARLFLGKREFVRKKSQVEVAVEDVLGKRPGAQLRFKRLITN